MNRLESEICSGRVRPGIEISFLQLHPYRSWEQSRGIHRSHIEQVDLSRATPGSSIWPWPASFHLRPCGPIAAESEHRLCELPIGREDNRTYWRRWQFDRTLG